METPRRWPRLALPSDHHQSAATSRSNSLSSKQLKLAYEEHAEAVLRLSQTYVRDLALAEDITHDVFERFWQSNGYDPERGTMRSYLLIMARSMALNHLNQINNRRSILKRWQPEFNTESTNPQDQLGNSEASGELQICLSKLRPDQRRILELCFLKDRSHAQVAEELRIPLGTVKSHIRRGLLAVRRLMEYRASR